MIQGRRKSTVCASSFNMISALHDNTHAFIPSLTQCVLDSITVYSSSVHGLERTSWSINLLHLAESDAVLQSLKSLCYCSKLHQGTTICSLKMI